MSAVMSAVHIVQLIVLGSEWVVDGTKPRDWWENEIIMVALKLAFLEKTATILSVVTFVWVILGGFARDLKPLDFWFVCIILLTKGARIFFRRHELLWQRHRSSDNSDGFTFRYWDIPQIKSFIWSCLQHIPNLACALLSLKRIIKQDYHRSDNGGTGNLKHALNGFYSLVLAESATLLGQRVFQHRSFLLMFGKPLCDLNVEPTILGHCKLFCRLSVRIFLFIDDRMLSRNHDRTLWGGKDRYGNNVFDLEVFFYHSYLKCMEGETLDGMRADLTCYAVELLLSRSLNEQVRGARILCNFLTDRKDKTGQKRRQYSLSKLENSSETLVKLIEMLRWEQKNSVDIPENDDLSGLRRILDRTLQSKKDLRRFATNILLEFVTEDPRNARRLASFPDFLDSILTLLSESEDESIPEDDRLNLKGLKLLEAITQKDDTRDKIGNTPALLSKIIEFMASFLHCQDSILTLLSEREDESGLNLKGLQLLEAITQNDDTRDKICNTSALRSKFIEFTAMKETMGLSLKVLLKLVQTEGPTGIRVRCNILENISIASNLRSILQTQNDVILNYAIDILMYLAMDNNEARGKIGCVRGITDGLLTLFLNKGNDKAGEILYMLSLEHQDNCDRIAESTGEVMEKLLDTLHDIIIHRINNDKHKIVIYSANILRNIFAYGSPDVSELRNKDYTVLQAAVNDIQMPTHELLLESYLGLAVAIYMVIEETRSLFDVQKLMNFLEYYREPSINVPCMRRYAIELATLMMDCNQESIATFRSEGLGEVLKGIRKTTSELESFYMFSGSIGPYSHEKTMYDLCRTATSYLSR